MKFIVTSAGNDNGRIYDVTIIARKLNGYWCKTSSGSVFFACIDHIRIIHITEEEQAMQVYWKPGYPGKEETEVNFSYRKVRKLSRSFDTLEQANSFADGKDVVEIYKYKGRWRVEWRKETVVNC